VSARASGATFAFSKLVVRDLERSAAFYRATCEYGEGQRVAGTMAGRSVEEIIFRSPNGGIDLVLIADPEHPSPPSPTGVITGFDTSDLDAFEARLLAAGGTVVEPARWVEFGANRMRIGFFADPQGFVLEIMER